MPPQKRKCKFNEALQKEFPFIKKTKIDTDVQCENCSITFSIANGGKYDIKRHIDSDRHKKLVCSAASSSRVDHFFRTCTFGATEKELAAAEAIFSFHTVKHNQSFRSMDCTSSLIQKLFEKKFACKRTKTEAIIKNVIATQAMDELRKDLENANFVSVFTDASNHKDLKLFPAVVRYFHPKNGIQIKLLDFVNLPGETSDIISDFLMELITKHNLRDKIIAFCADNANTNFGGVKRNGVNNIFTKLNTKLERTIIGVGCAAHIVHNAFQTAADLLPFDVENFIIKIYSHFYIYTVRVETLKQFCEESEVEYKKLLGYSKTRWLALLPAVERVLKLFAPLKAYFLSIEKCPKVIENFFNNSSSEIWLTFIHSQSALVQSTIKKIEYDSSSLMEVSTEINSLVAKYYDRISENYLPLIIRKDLKTLVENNEINENWFNTQVTLFYKNIVQYLELWCEQFKVVQGFDWVLLREQIKWDDVQSTLDKICSNFLLFKEIVSEEQLFDEISCLKQYANKEKVDQWVSNKLPCAERWVEIFNYFNQKNIPYKNLMFIVEYCFSLPGTNAVTERIFSAVNKVWSTEKTQLSIETLKAMLVVKINIAKTCVEYYHEIKADDEFLKKIHNSEKYQ